MIRLLFHPKNLLITPSPGLRLGRASLGVERVVQISRDHLEIKGVGEDNVCILHRSSNCQGGIVRKGSEVVELIPHGSECTLRMGDKYRVISQWDKFFLEVMLKEEGPKDESVVQSPPGAPLLVDVQPVGAPPKDESVVQSPPGAPLPVDVQPVGAPPKDESVVQSPPGAIQGVPAKKVLKRQGGGASLPVAGLAPAKKTQKKESADLAYVQFNKHGYDQNEEFMDVDNTENGVVRKFREKAAAVVTEKFNRQTGFQTKLLKHVVAKATEIHDADEKQCQMDEAKWSSPTIDRNTKWRSPTIDHRMRMMAKAALEATEKLVDAVHDDCDTRTMMWLEKRKAKLIKCREAAVRRGDDLDVMGIDVDIEEASANLEAALMGGEPVSSGVSEPAKRVIVPTVSST
jgi:pSer/pThr/pTyr-binding forkhead associated (FHA) protein